jgi:hypothetical protein
MHGPAGLPFFRAGCGEGRSIALKCPVLLQLLSPSGTYGYIGHVQAIVSMRYALSALLHNALRTAVLRPPAVACQGRSGDRRRSATSVTRQPHPVAADLSPEGI